jgi:hypothetical protein
VGEAVRPIPWAHSNPSAARCLHNGALRVRCGGRYASFRLRGKSEVCARSVRCALPSPPQAALCLRSCSPTHGASRGLQIAERIESLEERLKQLKATQQRIESRRRSLDSRRARRADTRRKILVGAVVLAKVDQGVLAESVLRGWLDGAFERTDDRALFRLAASGCPSPTRRYATANTTPAVATIGGSHERAAHLH